MSLILVRSLLLSLFNLMSYRLSSSKSWRGFYDAPLEALVFKFL